jgi:four helix bundle protein
MAFVRFQELGVYQLAEELADAIWKIVLQWDILARDTVEKQLIRAADSIGANIAEGSGGQSHKDNRRFIRIARGSLHETQHWLRRAFRRSLLTTEQTTILQVTIERLAPKLNAYLNSIGRITGTTIASNSEATRDDET